MPRYVEGEVVDSSVKVSYRILGIDARWFWLVGAMLLAFLVHNCAHLLPSFSNLASSREPQVRIAARDSHIRSGRGIEHSSLGTLRRGEQFEITEPDVGQDWLAVDTRVGAGYIRRYLAVDLAAVRAAGFTHTTRSTAHVRAAPDSSQPIIATLRGGSLIAIGAEFGTDDWHFCATEGDFGFIHRSLVTSR